MKAMPIMKMITLIKEANLSIAVSYSQITVAYHIGT